LRIVTADIGGTHARFALAEIAGGKVTSMGEPEVLHTRDYPGLPECWRAYGERLGQPLPPLGAFGLAGPVTGGPVQFMNSSWVVDPDTIATELGLDDALVLNDFGAMAHAVDALEPEHFLHLCGPDRSLPEKGAISVIGAGTGLGVAVLQRLPGDKTVVLETDGAHIGFAPLDETEAEIAAEQARRHGRCSIERIVSGPGLGAIVRHFAPDDLRDDKALWNAATWDHDSIASEALDLFVRCYGAAAGDLCLAHGSVAVALTGGLTNRIRDRIMAGPFHVRFCDKGRYRSRLESFPILLVTHPQPGLFGAAAAFARELCP